MTDVFISYSRKDKEFVSVLYEAFERNQKKSWVDWDNIPLTSDWWLEIEKGIEAADTFLFVISPDSVASSVCAKEIHHAVKNNKRLFPIVRREVTKFEEGNVAHATLQRHNWLMFREEDDFDTAFQKLTKALSQDLEYLRKHKQLLVKAIDWNESLRTDSLLLREDALYEAEIWLAESKTKSPQATELQEAFIERSRHIEEEQNREKIIFLENALARGNMRAKIGLAIFVVTILLAAGAWIWTYKRLNVEVITTEVGLKALDAQTDFNAGKKFRALLQAVKSGQDLKRLDRSDWEIKDTRAILVLNLSQFVYEINEKNRFSHSSSVTSVAFSPDHKLIITGTTKDGILELWSSDGKKIQTFKGHDARKITSVRFSPDGNSIASGGEDSTVKLWSLNGQELQTCKGHTDYVTSIAFSPDGKTIASGSKDKTVRLWSWDGEACREKKMSPIRAHNNQVTSIAFSPDSKIVASASADGNVKLWRIQDGKIQTTFKENGKPTAHESNVTSIAFSPDGKTIASSGGGLDKSIKLWSVGGKLIGFSNRTDSRNGYVNCLAFSPNGNYLVGGTDRRSVLLWSINRNDPKNIVKFQENFRGHNSSITSVAFSSDNKTIASASLDSSVRLWRLSKEPQKILKLHNSYVSSVAFSPDSQTIVTGSWDNKIKLWNRDEKHLKTFEGHRYNVMSVAFSPDGKTIASGSQDYTVKLWGIDGKILKTFAENSASITTIAFSPDGNTIATGGWDNVIKLWDLDGKLIKKFPPEHNFHVSSVAFSPDGKIIASGSQDRTIKLWNLDGSKPKELIGDGTAINSVAFSPDGKYIAAATDGGIVKLWNIDGRELKIFNGHSKQVTSVAFSFDSRTIASGSYDNTVKLWNLEGKELQTFKGHTSQVYSVAFSPDGKTLASGSADQTVILWNLDFDDLMVKGCAWLQDYLINNPNATVEERQMCGH